MYAKFTTEAIRNRCIINGFKISYTTADKINMLLWELGLLTEDEAS